MLLLLMALHGMECLFGQLGSAVLAVSPLPTPQPTQRGTERETEKALMLWKHHSPTAKSGDGFINAVLIINLKQTTIGAAIRKIDSIPARPSTVNNVVNTKTKKGQTQLSNKGLAIFV